MVLFEIKKVFSKFINKFAFIILIFVIAISIFLAVSNVTYVDSDGNSSSGIMSARKLRSEKNKWEGYITEEMLQKVIIENEKINNSSEFLSKDVKENEKAYSKKQGFSDIRNMISCFFSDFKTYNYYKADSVKFEDVGNLYKSRITNLEDWLNSEEASNIFSDNKKMFIIEKYKELETPLYYEYSDGWKSLFEYTPTIIMLSVLVSVFLVTSVFSCEFDLNADAIFFSTKFGRNKATRSKVVAGFLITTITYWASVILYSLFVLSILGFDGAECFIQTGLVGWKTFYNITYLQDYIITVVGGYVGSLFILTLSMLISAKTHSKVFAVTIPFIISFIPSFIGNIAPVSILGILPDQLLQVSTYIRSFYLYEIGGKVVEGLPIIFILYFVLYLIMLPIIYNIYKKSEVK